MKKHQFVQVFAWFKIVISLEVFQNYLHLKIKYTNCYRFTFQPKHQS